MRGLVILLLATPLVIGCGAEAGPKPERTRALAVTSAEMTRVVPEKMRRVCASAAVKGTVPVRCPRLLPEQTYMASVLSPRRSVPRPGAPGDSGVRRFRGARDYYVIEAASRSILPERHWLTGSGSARSLEKNALRSMRPPGVERVSAAGRRIEIRRYPPYPDGGINGGHVVALARDGPNMTYVSVHGGEHRDVAMAMLVDLLANAS